ncbi:hypothetical protein [Lentibacillus saliphilus]|uniref:hypothetical protein n=1 Tax=Lentibacillus saliphilus TaxID=2737028 RepID=UPI001C2F6C68|nr:hypothetical protein [Lentibacillus saliphilus]
MKKTYFIAIGASVSAAALAGAMMSRTKQDHKRSIASNIQEAGMPDQTEHRDAAQLENAKMVSEGSQFGVHYFNNAQEEQ